MLTPGKYGAGVLGSIVFAMDRSKVVAAVTTIVVVVVLLMIADALMLFWSFVNEPVPVA